MKNNLDNMRCLDIYLPSLSVTDLNIKNPNAVSSRRKMVPLMSWDIFSVNYFKTIENFKIESDIKSVKAFAKKGKWKNEIDAIFENQDFEALIITDADQNILWVNDGFTTMTGYSKKYALNKKPHFLQGTNTSVASRKNIRTKLSQLEPFTEIITNYRKDNSPYECEVKIIPMYNESVTHFLAIERKVV